MTHIWGILISPRSVQGLLGSFGALSAKNAFSSKVAGRREKRAEIWYSGTLVTHI